MQRVTISIDEALGEAFDQLIAEQGYQSRSEAMRDLVRKAVEGRRAAGEAGVCVANLSYVFNHHTRALSQRLAALGHDHHDLVVATTHVHLDHENCLESVMLKGPTARVRGLADAIQAERGVRFGDLNLISVGDHGEHAMSDEHRHGPHGHLTPTSR